MDCVIGILSDKEAKLISSIHTAKTIEIVTTNSENVSDKFLIPDKNRFIDLRSPTKLINKIQRLMFTTKKQDLELTQLLVFFKTILRIEGFDSNKLIYNDCLSVPTLARINKIPEHVVKQIEQIKTEPVQTTQYLENQKQKQEIKKQKEEKEESQSQDPDYIVPYPGSDMITIHKDACLLAILKFVKSLNEPLPKSFQLSLDKQQQILAVDEIFATVSTVQLSKNVNILTDRVKVEDLAACIDEAVIQYLRETYFDGLYKAHGLLKINNQEQNLISFDESDSFEKKTAPKKTFSDAIKQKKEEIKQKEVEPKIEKDEKVSDEEAENLQNNKYAALITKIKQSETPKERKERLKAERLAAYKKEQEEKLKAQAEKDARRKKALFGSDVASGSDTDSKKKSDVQKKEEQVVPLLCDPIEFPIAMASHYLKSKTESALRHEINDTLVETENIEKELVNPLYNQYLTKEELEKIRSLRKNVTPEQQLNNRVELSKVGCKYNSESVFCPLREADLNIDEFNVIINDPCIKDKHTGVCSKGRIVRKYKDDEDLTKFRMLASWSFGCISNDEVENYGNEKLLEFAHYRIPINYSRPNADIKYVDALVYNKHAGMLIDGMFRIGCILGQKLNMKRDKLPATLYRMTLHNGSTYRSTDNLFHADLGLHFATYLEKQDKMFSTFTNEISKMVSAIRQLNFDNKYRHVELLMRQINKLKFVINKKPVNKNDKTEKWLKEVLGLTQDEVYKKYANLFRLKPEQQEMFIKCLKHCIKDKAWNRSSKNNPKPILIKSEKEEQWKSPCELETVNNVEDLAIHPCLLEIDCVGVGLYQGNIKHRRNRLTCVVCKRAYTSVLNRDLCALACNVERIARG